MAPLLHLPLLLHETNLWFFSSELVGSAEFWQTKPSSLLFSSGKQHVQNSNPRSRKVTEWNFERSNRQKLKLGKISYTIFGAAETGVALRRGLVVKRPITPPCHGGDRRFESGRARQEKRVTLRVALFSWADIVCDANRRSRGGRQGTAHRSLLRAR